MTEACLSHARPPDATKSRVRTIVIIGAGFSGAMTAVNLLRLAPRQPLRVVLINKSGRMARGIAYGTRSAEHVLNVPAGNMSALADDPEDFLRFCRWSDPDVGPASFVLRRIYGTYLEALLAAAEHSGGDATVLERETEEVVSVRLDASGERAQVLLGDGRALIADHVVLAFGHFSPADPPVSTPSFYGSRRYIKDPWEAAALHRVGDDDPVLLLGTGLTAVDVALSLQHGRPRAPIVCISRRGLAPQAHRSTRGVPHRTAVDNLLHEMGSSVRGYVSALRREVERRAQAGDDWRDVLASLRPHTATLWRRLSRREQARFLRHVQPYWDVLRHRCAPVASTRYGELLASGAVSVFAGRVLAYHEDAQGVQVTWRPRGAPDRIEHLRVSYVINCTGPDSDLRRCRTPLIRDLLAQGSIRPDALGLGVDVDDDYAVLDAHGQPSSVLHYVGPLLKARDWEATAVPELRAHAARLAQRLLAALDASVCD